MKLLTKILFIILLVILNINTSLAELENINIKENINISETLNIDLSVLEKKLKSENNSNILFEWNIP